MDRQLAVVTRLEQLQRRLAGLDVAGMLVSDLVNVRYLCGFDSSNAALVVDAESVWLLTDGRYAESARGIEGVELIRAERNLVADLAARLPQLVDGPIAFEADVVTFADHEKIAAGGVELRPVKGVVEELRAVKDPAELDAIRAAARILDTAIAELAGERVAGRSETDLAWWLTCRMRELGADDVSFDPIVASGPNSALPHHHPGHRVVAAGETLLVDAGARVAGYCSDCTRTFAVGTLPDELLRAYDVCLSAQVEALGAVAVGAACKDVDAVARARILDAGFEVMHGLGHAVGLEIHEDPRLSDTSTATLAAGNVVTVEPGVYLPDRGGVRIEDLVVVGETGPEVLTPFTKELVAIG